MKKSQFIILSLFISTVAFSQKKDTTSVPQKQLTDTTEFLSISDISRYAEGLKDRVSARQYDYWFQMMNQIIALAADEYKQKQLPKTSK